MIGTKTDPEFPIADLGPHLDAVTQAVRELTIYAAPVQIARTALDVLAREGCGDVRELQARLAAVQALVDQAAEADAAFGRTNGGGCVSVAALRAALTAIEGNRGLTAHQEGTQ